MTEPDRPIRSFVAIDIEEPVRPAIVAYLAELRQRIDDAAWTPPENVHLTLKFLGSVAPDRLATLGERLASIAAEQPSFPIAFDGVGAFPSVARPRILWVGAAAAELGTLAAAVDAASVTIGVTPEERPFHPHVTLARLRERRGRRDRDSVRAARAVLAADGARAFGTAPARSLVLFRSDTGPRGARHTPLLRQAFRAA